MATGELRPLSPGSILKRVASEHGLPPTKVAQEVTPTGDVVLITLSPREQEILEHVTGLRQSLVNK